MTLEQLFEIGSSFNEEVKSGTAAEQDLVAQNREKAALPQEMVEVIKAYAKPIKFLVAGEVWCKDFALNISVLQNLVALNPQFEMRIITMFRGRKFLVPLLEKEAMHWPVVVAMTEDYEVLGVFEERPKVAAEVEDFETIKEAYLNGAYLMESAKEFMTYLGA